MEAFLPGLVVSLGTVIAAVVVVALCVYRRKKQTHPVGEPSADVSDVEDPRKGFTFDDPYHSIDISDDVKTLSSANSGDSAFDTSNNGSGQNVQISIPEESSAVGTNEAVSSGSSSQADASNGSGAEVVDEAVYEVIAFEHDGSVIHNPSPAVASALCQDSEVSDPDFQTYEDVGGDELDVSESPASSLKGKDDSEATAGDDDVFEEPLYSPVYESTYVDCVSCSSLDRKDSGVGSDMVPSPTESEPGVRELCKSRTNSKAQDESTKSPEVSSSSDTKPSSHWASIKSRVNQLRKQKKAASDLNSGSPLNKNTPAPSQSNVTKSSGQENGKPFSYISNGGTSNPFPASQVTDDEYEDCAGTPRGNPWSSAFQSQHGSSGQNTPRSDLKPKPPVPPKPGNKS